MVPTSAIKMWKTANQTVYLLGISTPNYPNKSNFHIFMVMPPGFLNGMDAMSSEYSIFMRPSHSV
jgi:hypothetical protein